MAKKDLLKLLKSLSAQDLKNMISVKGKLDQLNERKKGLEKDLTLVKRKIASLESLFGKSGVRSRPASLKKAKRKRIVQPPLSSLVVDIFKEKKKPLAIDEICDALLNEKKYQTQARNFKGNVRILLYVNQKGLFKKVKPGVFALVGEKGRK